MTAVREYEAGVGAKKGEPIKTVLRCILCGLVKPAIHNIFMCLCIEGERGKSTN